jgi:hypothetical protein
MKQFGKDAPLAVVSKPWQRHVLLEDGSVDPRAYTFCALDELRTAIRRRDVFVSPSWRYADPRIGLLTGGEWDTARPIICRTLGFTSDPARPGTRQVAGAPPFAFCYERGQSSIREGQYQPFFCNLVLPFLPIEESAKPSRVTGTSLA